ncbi:MAG TPA: HAD family hydrolase [Anaeromyxobacteraceae bacterium]|nr:HAD family hydrolase [Anaeromyxobacteraceae bacterium]
MIRAALFDIDGTLIDTVDLHAAAWQQAFEHFGVAVSYDEVRSQIGKGGDKLIPVFLSPEEEERFGPDLEEYRNGLYLREYLPLAVPFPGARELLERVAGAGIAVALASSCKKAELEHNLRLVGIEQLVSAAVTSDDIEESKPEPDVFEAALDKLGVEGQAALAIGDSPYDATAAARAGVRTIGLLCGGFPAEALRDAGCIALYEGPADLLLRFDASPLAPWAAEELAAPP